jgi:DNA repair protein RadC
MKPTNSEIVVRDATDLVDPLRKLYGNEINFREKVFAVYMDNYNRVIGFFPISVGGYDCTTIDPRVVFSSAMTSGASKVILSHNHPSGNLEPSPQDISITKRIVEGGKLLNVEILDHIIVTDSNYMSIRRNHNEIFG